jgi:2-polyprenyl-6-methoxyphenol hydroxylase-like FAD-dependent oxidoreductase
MTLHVAIVGAGLGGLAAALFLRKADIDVTVSEQARELPKSEPES